MKRAITTFLFLLIVTVGFVTTGQTDRGGLSRETIRSRMVQFLRYVELEQKATPADIDKMVDLWSRATQAGLTQEERTESFRDLFLQYHKLHGKDYSNRPDAMNGLAQIAATSFEHGAELDLRLPEPRGPISGDFIHVETEGHGKVQMILIPGAGNDGRDLYRSFIERNKDRYTMQIVTLPGAGRAKPQPWPEVYDLTQRPWLNNIEQSLVTLLEKTRGKVVVIGTTMGGYFAARLALRKPEKIMAAVLVDARANMPMPSRTTPGGRATLEERLSIMKTYIPIPQLFPIAEVPTDREELRKLLDDPNSSNPSVKNWMAFAVKDESLSKRWTIDSLSNGFFKIGVRYGGELQTTDLTEELKNLSVPTLAISALHDEKSPSAKSLGVDQWKEIKSLYPSIPLSLVTIADARSYISEDRPEEFDRTLTSFLSGK